MDGDDYRTGSADSENGSDNSYVQVSREDLSEREPSPSVGGTTTNIPSVDDSKDIYGDSEDQEHEKTLGAEETVNPDTPPPEAFKGGNYMDSPPEPAEPTPPVPSSRVEEVSKPASSYEVPSSKSPTVSSVKPGVSVPEAKGYLSFLNALHPIILYMIYWKDVKLSAVVLGVELVLLLTLSLNTLLHTVVLFLLSFLVVSLTYIVSKIVIDSFYNREVKNPFSDYLNKKITLPEDKIIEWTQYIIEHLNQRFNRLVRLLLFDNIKQSLKFGFTLWLLSFVTNCLTVLCVLFLVVILAFTVPVLYEKFQPVIDSNLNKVLKVTMETFNTVKSKIPYIGKKKAD